MGSGVPFDTGPSQGAAKGRLDAVVASVASPVGIGEDQIFSEGLWPGPQRMQDLGRERETPARGEAQTQSSLGGNGRGSQIGVVRWTANPMLLACSPLARWVR